MDINSLYQVFLRHPAVQTDTRKIKNGDIFFALKGPHFDGNAFAGTALEHGAAAAVIDDKQYYTDDRMIVVDDALHTLQKLAGYHRDQLKIPFVAITGSNGKTTTKELIREVLRTTYRTYATEGNLNNHIGIPLTLLRIREDVEIAVIEMGANHQREIAGYCDIVKPTHGIITNIGKAHLEGFGGLEGVKKGKGELFDYLREHAGTAFACSNFAYFTDMLHGINSVYRYGTTPDQYVSGKVDSSDPYLVVETDYTGEIETRLIGDYNVYNVLSAVTVGKYFHVRPEKIGKAIAAYQPVNARSQLMEKEGNKYILDAYNANPSSMRAAITNFAHAAAQHKVLMLGGMMELGEDSLAEHQQLVDFIGNHTWDEVVLVGGDFAHVNALFTYLPDAEAAKAWLQDRHFHNATILIKGSRSIAMEKVLD